MPACQPSAQSEYSGHCGLSTEYQVSPCLNLRRDAFFLVNSLTVYLPRLTISTMATFPLLLNAKTRAQHGGPLNSLAKVLMILIIATNE